MYGLIFIIFYRSRFAKKEILGVTVCLKSHTEHIREEEQDSLFVVKGSASGLTCEGSIIRYCGRFICLILQKEVCLTISSHNSD
jgi:hypothetical protein